MAFRISDANLDLPQDAAAVQVLLASYARDPMGGGIELTADVQRRLIPALRNVPHKLILLGWWDEIPSGLLVAFYGFSTFQAAPLLNIHDVAVHPDFRGRGIGRELLNAAEVRARESGCCRVTLEVRADNTPAKRLYESCGFRAGNPPQEFWTKPLS